MPAFFGVEYPNVPAVGDLYGSCALINQYTDPNSQLREFLNQAPIFLPLSVAINAALFEDGGALRTDEATWDSNQQLVQDVFDALQGYENYLVNVASINYEAQTDAQAMYNNAPTTGFGNALNWVFGNTNQNYPTDNGSGSCDMTQNYIQNHVFPLLNGISSDVAASYQWVQMTRNEIEQAIQNQLTIAQTLTSIADLENEYLQRQEENRKIYDNIRRSIFAENVSQFSIIGAALFLGSDLVKAN